jgi:hypothetical protein
MGGDANQPLGYVGDAPPTPVISLNARGQGASSDIARCWNQLTAAVAACLKAGLTDIPGLSSTSSTPASSTTLRHTSLDAAAHNALPMAGNPYS